MRSRANGALWGIWGSPQQAETGRFSLRRKSSGLPKGYHTALLATVWFRWHMRELFLRLYEHFQPLKDINLVERAKLVNNLPPISRSFRFQSRCGHDIIKKTNLKSVKNRRRRFWMRNIISSSLWMMRNKPGEALRNM